MGVQSKLCLISAAQQQGQHLQTKSHQTVLVSLITVPADQHNLSIPQYFEI